jgi:hypothetical protein
MYLLSHKVEYEGNKIVIKREKKITISMNNLRTKVGNKRNGKMETKLAEARKGVWGGVKLNSIMK